MLVTVAPQPPRSAGSPLNRQCREQLTPFAGGGEHLSGYSAPGSSRRLFQMGRLVKLIKLVERLAELDGEDTIYACEPWTEDSDAMVAREDPESVQFGIPLEAAEAGMKYF